jgi:hypothetical protein
VRLDPNAVIAPDKIRDYLLAHRLRNDKSRFFGRAGYTQDRWQQLAADLRAQLLPGDAMLSRHTPYGTLYTIDGPLVGPSRTVIQVTTVWIVEAATGLTRLVTAYPSERSETADDV